MTPDESSEQGGYLDDEQRILDLADGTLTTENVVDIIANEVRELWCPESITAKM
jgi:hypothetical protein